MTSECDLIYSEEAEKNRYLFFSDSNDVNIFVEDKDKEFEYETIFKRMFKDKYRITSIISLGGKRGVIEGFKEFGEIDLTNNTANIYIVDGDFDRLIHKNEMINNPCFIYLKTYNVENYFVEREAILSLAKGKLHLRDGDVENRFLYDNWKQGIIQQAYELFLLHCAVQKTIIGEQNVGCNEYRFIDSNTGMIKEEEYSLYHEEMCKKNRNIDDEVELIREEYNHIYGDDGYNLICGKFLLTSLYCYFRRICKKRTDKDDFRWWLINNFNISRMDYIKQAINKQVDNRGV